MHHRRHHHFVTFGEEARRDHPNDQVLGGGGARDGRASARIGSNRSRGQAPRRERVGIRDRDAAFTLRIRHQVADPVDRIGKVLAHLSLRRLVAFEIGERERPSSAPRQLQSIATGVADEVIRARKRRGHARVFAAIEEANGIGRVVRLHAVDGLIDHGEADLRLDRLARGVGDGYVEHPRIAGL